MFSKDTTYTRISNFNRKVFAVSEELGNSVGSSLPSMDDHCRKHCTKPYQTYWEYILGRDVMSISAEVVSKKEEAIVNGMLKPTITRALDSLSMHWIAEGV
jgi:hypothetical protein